MGPNPAIPTKKRKITKWWSFFFISCTVRDEEPRGSGSDSEPVNEVNAKAKRDSHPVRTRRAGENEVNDRLIPLFRLKISNP